jgi:hypothetical protein
VRTSRLVYNLQFFTDLFTTSYAFVPSLLLSRHYVSPEDKEKLSKALPSSFYEINTGMMLGDGNIRMNGKHALLSIQQKNKEFVDHL